MSDLTEFLLARIAEDEAAEYWIHHDDCDRHTPPGFPCDCGWPARVLAQCAALRAVVEDHRLITDPQRLVKVWRDPTPGVACERCAGDPLGDDPLEDIGPCDTLRALASIWADHPDYDPTWRLT